jgi:hypothetical protein
LNKKPGMHQPQRVEKAKILIANTPMDTDKIKVFGSRVKVDNIAKVSVCSHRVRKILLDTFESRLENYYIFVLSVIWT